MDLGSWGGSNSESEEASDEDEELPSGIVVFSSVKGVALSRVYYGNLSTTEPSTTSFE